MNNNYHSIKHILALECGSWKKTFFLEKNRYSLGRNSTNTLFCYHRVISRNHAQIIKLNYESLVNPDQWESVFWLVDGDFLGNRSTNGVYVNGKKTSCQVLHPGDIIFFGGIDVKAKYDIVDLHSKTFFSISSSDFKSLFSPDLLNTSASGLTIFSTFTEDNFEGLELATVGILIVDLSTGKILKVNQYYCQMFGYSPADIIGLNLSDLDASEKDIINYDLSILQKYHVRGDRTSVHRRKNKQLINVTVKSIPINYDEKKCILLSVENNQDLQKLEEVLRYQNYHDLATNLANKSLLEKQLAWSLGFNSLKKGQIALIKIKINHWDSLINEMEIASIEQLLEKFISQVKSLLSSLDCFCHYSDDEYYILKEEIEDKSQVYNFVNKLLTDCQKPIIINGKPIILSINCGLAIHPENGKTKEELIKNADLALEYSYNYGVDNCQFFHQYIQQNINNRNKNKALIYDIINQNKFNLKYQPIFNVKTQQILSLNSLICLEQEDKKLDNIDILALVKKLNYDGELLLWNLETIIKDYHSWGKKPPKSPFPISLKVLLSTLLKPKIINKINHLINSKNSHPQLELEIILDYDCITEKTMLQTLNNNPDNKINTLPLLFSLFNPDVNNILNLQKRKIKLNSLKIPAKLINKLTEKSLEAHLISHLVEVSKTLEINIIAEGVNTENQKEILLNLGCENMQGLYFSQPVSSEEVSKILSH